MSSELDLRRPRSDAVVRFWVVALALVVGFFGVVSSVYVHYDSYLIVLRQVLFVVLPWAAVWAAFRRAYTIAAACFAITAAVGYWISDFQVWGIPVLGALVTVGAVIQAVTSREREQ